MLRMFAFKRPAQTAASGVETATGGPSSGDSENASAACRSQKELIDLNEHCLVEILERLSHIDDLCAVAATCTRLNFVAYQIWERRHKNQSLNFEQIVRKHGPNGRAQIVRYLSGFGELLTSIEFTLPDDKEWQQLTQMDYEQARWNDSIFAALVAHCGPTLQALEMRGLGLSVPRTPPGQPAFGRLQKLKLDYCIDLQCYEYERQLHVDWYFNKAYVFLRHLAGTETLQQLEISQMLLTKEFLMLLCECRQLTVLKLNGIRDDRFCSEQTFALWLSQLRSIVDLQLVVEYFDANFPNSVAVFLNHIGSADTVERLHICGGEADDQLLRGLRRFRRLRQLTIGHFTHFNAEHFALLDDVVADVVEFTMTAWNQLTPDDLVAAVGRMERLETLRLHIGEYEEIDEATFVALVAICRRRNRQLIIEHTEQILTWNIDHELIVQHCAFVDLREICL